MSFRFAGALAIVLASLIALAVAPVAGAAKPHKTRLIVSKKAPAFHGSIRSPDERCVIARTVVVNRRLKGKVKHIGTASTLPNGQWTVRVRLTSGEYWVTVRPIAGRCGGARSKPVVVD